MRVRVNQVPGLVAVGLATVMALPLAAQEGGPQGGPRQGRQGERQGDRERQRPMGLWGALAEVGETELTLRMRVPRQRGEQQGEQPEQPETRDVAVALTDETLFTEPAEAKADELEVGHLVAALVYGEGDDAAARVVAMSDATGTASQQLLPALSSAANMAGRMLGGDRRERPRPVVGVALSLDPLTLHTPEGDVEVKLAEQVQYAKLVLVERDKLAQGRFVMVVPQRAEEGAEQPVASVVLQLPQMPRPEGGARERQGRQGGGGGRPPAQ